MSIAVWNAAQLHLMRGSNIFFSGSVICLSKPVATPFSAWITTAAIRLPARAHKVTKQISTAEPNGI